LPDGRINFTFKDEAGNTLSDIGIAANDGTEYGSALYMPTGYSLSSLALGTIVTNSTLPTLVSYQIGENAAVSTTSLDDLKTALTGLDTGTTNVTVTVSNRYALTIRCSGCKAGYTLQSSTAAHVASYTASRHPLLTGIRIRLPHHLRTLGGGAVQYVCPSPLDGQCDTVDLQLYGLTNRCLS
jgi:hypothetical protein